MYFQISLSDVYQFNDIYSTNLLNLNLNFERTNVFIGGWSVSLSHINPNETNRQVPKVNIKSVSDFFLGSRTFSNYNNLTTNRDPANAIVPLKGGSREDIGTLFQFQKLFSCSFTRTLSKFTMGMRLILLLLPEKIKKRRKKKTKMERKWEMNIKEEKCNIYFFNLFSLFWFLFIKCFTDLYEWNNTTGLGCVWVEEIWAI